MRAPPREPCSHPSTRPPVHPSTRPPVRPSTRPPVHPSTRPPVHPSTASGALCRELASFIRYTFSVSLFAGLDERLRGYAQQLEFVPTSLPPEEFKYRNGFCYRYSKMAGTRTTGDGRKVEVPDTTPGHTAYLGFALEEGVLTQELLDSV